MQQLVEKAIYQQQTSKLLYRGREMPYAINPAPRKIDTVYASKIPDIRG